MNKFTALALAGAFGLLTAQTAHATSANTGDAGGQPPAPPPQGADQHAGGPPPPGDHGPSSPERFKEADTNNDGFLTKDEMLDAQKKRLDKLFEESDTNHDGKLSREELDAGFKAMRAKMMEHFKQGGQPEQAPPKQ